MGSIETIVEASLVGSHGAIEQELFGAATPGEIAGILEEFLLAHFGQRPEGLFYESSVGIVLGARLAEGLEVVVKVHRWNVNKAKLRAVQRVQRELSARKLPFPCPLMEPTTVGMGIATVDELIIGEVADGHNPDVRRVITAELCRLAKEGRSLGDVTDLGPPALLRAPDEALWPVPHSPIFDFESTREGAEWIDELATSARRRLDQRSDEQVVGHFDWRVGNLGFRGNRLVAIYDLDSLALAPEPVIVGNAAAAFSYDWSKPGGSPPDISEMRAFVAEYERARGREFDRNERDVLDAANLFHIAYGARCQWSATSLNTPGRDPAGSWIASLRERSAQVLIS